MIKYKAYLFGGPIKDELRIIKQYYKTEDVIENEIIVEGCSFKRKVVPTLGENTLKYEFVKKIADKCEICSGEGKVECPQCGGDGEIDCHECDGEGVIYNE